ncbi:hypothetical protein ABIB29_000012 [Arthrobacter sp. UYEF36]
METHRPAYVFIETSINDTRDDLAITPDHTVENMRAAVSMVRMFGATPIVGTSAPIFWQTFGAPYSAQSVTEQGQANTLVKAAMAELGVQVVDLFAAFQGEPQNLTDGIHPNDTGYDQWATNIARAIAGRTLITYTPPVQPYSADTFSRGDSANLGNAETGGQAWTTANPTYWNIVLNKLVSTSAAGGIAPNDCLVNTGQANGTVKITRSSNPTSSGLAFRVSADNSTGYLIYRSSGNYLPAKRTTAVAYTTLVTSSGITPTADDVVSVILNGSTSRRASTACSSLTSPMPATPAPVRAHGQTLACRPSSTTSSTCRSKRCARSPVGSSRRRSRRRHGAASPAGTPWTSRNQPSRKRSIGRAPMREV